MIFNFDILNYRPQCGQPPRIVRDVSGAESPVVSDLSEIFAYVFDLYCNTLSSKYYVGHDPKT